MNEMIKVSVRCSGSGSSYDETVEISREEIEQLACNKMRAMDASPRIEALGTEICLKAYQGDYSHYAIG